MTNTPAPTSTPLPTATAVPPTATPAPCTTLNCNPWGYSFDPTGGSLIYNPPDAFCSYFACIPNFPNGNGYVMECQDSMFSKSGGIQGSCSHHGGNWRPLYAH